MSNMPITESEVSKIQRTFRKTATIPGVVNALKITRGRALTLLVRAGFKRVKSPRTKPCMWTCTSKVRSK